MAALASDPDARADRRFSARLGAPRIMDDFISYALLRSASNPEVALRIC